MGFGYEILRYAQYDKVSGAHSPRLCVMLSVAQRSRSISTGLQVI